ncbi:MAG: hypothetical protein GXP08_07235 [Gammaproteobacteria bacterium]|nr:hypothetical protein [Gammaproteobacteria bacterium]
MLFVTVLFVIVGVGGGMYWLGNKKAGYHNETLIIEHRQLLGLLAELQKINAKLLGENTELTQSAAIDKEAYANVDSSLRRLQNEILELKEQVTFYSGIVSPTKMATGLSIAYFSINKVGNQHGYHFKLVLTQVKQNNPLVRGKAKIFIAGVQDGELRQLDILALSGNTKSELKLRFKYFQTLEGDIVLPEGFAPSSVSVDLRLSGKGQHPIKQTFNWSQVIS